MDPEKERRLLELLDRQDVWDAIVSYTHGMERSL